MNRLSLTSHAPEETMEIGRVLGSLLSTGMFVALDGQLGGGKTCFTRGIVSGAAPDSVRLVASPTYAIMNEYPGAPPIFHFDFYRLSGEEDIIDLGFDELFSGDGIFIAEWSERMGQLLPTDHLTVSFEHAGEELRSICFSATGFRSQELLERFSAALKA